MGHFLGLDVGGTKTFCLIGDGQGRIAGFGHAGTGNYEYQGVAPAAEENRRAVKQALDRAGLTLRDIEAIGMGVSGADLPEDHRLLDREIYGPLFGDIPRVFRNDSMAALRGATRAPHGIVIVCGTGCVCAGKNASGVETRVGGFGADFGDACTGASLGEEGLRCVWRARDGIIGPTALTRGFLARAQCEDVDDLFYRWYRRELAAQDLEPMAQVVCEAALDGDHTACGILRRGGEYLGAMVNAVARKLSMTDLSHEVVMAGGVFKDESGVLAGALRRKIVAVSRQATLVRPRFEPVVGALLLGIETRAVVTDDLYRRLETELLAAEDRYGVQFRTG